MSRCTMPFDGKSAASNTAPRVGDHGYRCYPRLAIPMMVRDFAKPWWDGCTIWSRKHGMIDPPYAMETGVGLASLTPHPPTPDDDDDMDYPGDDEADILQNMTTHETFDDQPTPTPEPYPAPAQAPDHDLPAATPPPTPKNNEYVSYKKPYSQGGTVLPPDDNNKHPGVNNDSPSVNVASAGDSPTNNQPPKNESPSVEQQASGNQPPKNEPQPVEQQASGNQPPKNEPATDAPAAEQQGAENQPVSAVSVSIIATNVITSPPVNSGAGVEAGVANPPNEADQTHGGPVPGAPAEQGTSGSPTIAVPANEPGKVIYMGHTLQQGGPLATITSIEAVVSYGSKGVIVQYPHGLESTITVQVIPVAPGVLTSGNPNVPTEIPYLVVVPTTSDVSKVGDAADIASFINYVMNGEPIPDGKTPDGKTPDGENVPPAPGVSSNPASGSVPDSSSSGEVGESGTNNGGASNGGESNGGTSNGGTSNGGTSNGGTSNGGTSNGGASNGGSPASNDSTEGVVQFAGNAKRESATMQWMLAAMAGVGIIVFL